MVPSYLSVMYDNNLNLFQSAISPEYANIVIKNPHRITGMRFVFQKNKEKINLETERTVLQLGFSNDIAKATATYDSTYVEKIYFIGDIVDYEQIKHLINSPPDKEKNKKYAVSYNEDGNISDIRPINAGEEVYALKNASELEQIYYEITGFTISIVQKNRKKL